MSYNPISTRRRLEKPSLGQPSSKPSLTFQSWTGGISEGAGSSHSCLSHSSLLTAASDSLVVSPPTQILPLLLNPLLTVDSKFDKIWPHVDPQSHTTGPSVLWALAPLSLMICSVTTGSPFWSEALCLLLSSTQRAFPNSKSLRGRLLLVTRAQLSLTTQSKADTHSL